MGPQLLKIYFYKISEKHVKTIRNITMSKRSNGRYVGTTSNINLLK